MLRINADFYDLRSSVKVTKHYGNFNSYSLRCCYCFADFILTLKTKKNSLIYFAVDSVGFICGCQSTSPY